MAYLSQGENLKIAKLSHKIKNSRIVKEKAIFADQMFEILKKKPKIRFYSRNVIYVKKSCLSGKNDILENFRAKSQFKNT